MKSKIPFRRICWLGFKADIPMPGMGVSFSVEKQAPRSTNTMLKSMRLDIVTLSRATTPIIHTLPPLPHQRKQAQQKESHGNGKHRQQGHQHYHIRSEYTVAPGSHNHHITGGRHGCCIGDDLQISICHCVGYVANGGCKGQSSALGPRSRLERFWAPDCAGTETDVVDVTFLRGRRVRHARGQVAGNAEAGDRRLARHSGLGFPGMPR